MKWHGMAELRAGLRSMATDLASDSNPMVRQAATDAAASMASSYPRSSGPGPHLAESLVVTQRQTSDTAARFRVTNTAPHAHWFEGGTRGRPPGRVFVPIHAQFRRTMYEALKRLLPRYNLRPRGEAVE
jgi:HK97 gp10 family phage protein